MPRTALAQTGARIRARRLDLGLRQADLAEKAGISPSYLNLIEHDKRRIAGRLLTKIAGALNIQASLLTEGAERAVLDALQSAASAWPQGRAEIARADELAARYPGWAGLIAAQSARIAALETQVQTLTDRITYDPDLATALHGVISAVTAIRSTAAILTSDEKIDAEWQGRFHRNIHDDAVRLAADSDALVSYFDPPDDAAGLPLSPLEEAEALLSETGWHLAPLETGGDMGAAMAGLRKPAREVLSDWVRGYAKDAAALPLTVIEDAVAVHGFDVWALAQALEVDVTLLLRRLASLPVSPDRAPLGLVVCDAAGFPTVLKQVPGFAFPRGTACPLWPVFAALGQPGRPITAEVTVPGQPETRLLCTAIAEQKGDARPDRPPLMQAVMLVQPDPPPGAVPPIAAGVTCRICPRVGCAARREPSVLLAEDREPL